jgi:ATP-dependent protease ClpP protease subunit
VTRIDIVGEINAGLLASVRSQLSEPAADLDILVDSNGGDLDAALDLYAVLLAHPAHKTAIIRNASSAALFPALAADKRIAAQGARVLLHQSAYAPPATERWTANRYAEVAEQLRRHDAEMAAVLAYRTGTPAHVFRAEMETETEASFEWCLAHGVIHEIKETE